MFLGSPAADPSFGNVSWIFSLQQISVMEILLGFSAAQLSSGNIAWILIPVVAMLFGSFPAADPSCGNGFWIFIPVVEMLFGSQGSSHNNGNNILWILRTLCAFTAIWDHPQFVVLVRSCGSSGKERSISQSRLERSVPHSFQILDFYFPSLCSVNSFCRWGDQAGQGCSKVPTFHPPGWVQEWGFALFLFIPSLGGSDKSWETSGYKTSSACTSGLEQPALVQGILNIPP